MGHRLTKFLHFRRVIERCPSRRLFSVRVWRRSRKLVLTHNVTVSERILARDPMEEIRRAFQLFDDDNTGKISLRNLRRVAKEIGDRLEDDELCVAVVFSPSHANERHNF